MPVPRLVVVIVTVRPVRPPPLGAVETLLYYFGTKERLLRADAHLEGLKERMAPRHSGS
jgi:hypothetical protein